MGAPPVPRPQTQQAEPKASPAGRNRFATLALILGLLGSALSGTPLWPIAGIGATLAIAFGLTAQKQIFHSGGRQTGRGMAIAGIVLGSVVVVITLLALIAVTGSRGPGIQNGSFESPGVLSGSNIVESIPGWRAVDPCSFRLNNSPRGFGPANDGDQWAELNANCVGGIVQTLKTSPGHTYDLSFAFGARPGTSATQNQMEVVFNGTPVARIGPLAAPGLEIKWVVHHVSVTAGSSKSTLMFRGTDPDSTDTVGTELDSVSLRQAG